ncbi:radical SAM protein, MSMEG_0568 family [Pseudonocardia ammonioxydans]|uniref:Radical SAM protein, MSMEG_0568 family n=1 Tax=Pseudonocardia ammonioxydans TaxID=260086 RepID=A0A1I5BHF0_PSUAM|nr:MSMEG_0568 family radical SAM protein [Pseudonocardia ammonioxydans]SFN74164.1 radical SAM protein, MSMEG_0568 family [Pseudonocardia ammonioxydans]
MSAPSPDPTDLAELTELGLQARAEMAVRGVALDPGTPPGRGSGTVTELGSVIPLRRPGGAGPSADGHVLVDGLRTTVPIVADSPFRLRDGRLVRSEPGGGVTDMGVAVDTVARPAFYDLTTADGVSYEQIARLHGNDVLASTVVQTCVRYGESDRCRFCAIEQSLRSGATTAVKTPAQLAEVAEAAVRLDGVRQMVLTTGTSNGRDRGARHLVRCVRAIRAAVPGLPVQVQCEPPAPEDIAVLTDLRAAGADAIGIHVESLDDDVRRRWMPGKATVPLSQYRAAWDEAVRVFGPDAVSTYLIVGLGEDPDELVAGAAELIARGVYPFVVPYRPIPGTLAFDDGVPGPDPALLAEVTARVAAELRASGMRGADQAAGCAACGACSALSAAGG